MGLAIFDGLKGLGLGGGGSSEAKQVVSAIQQLQSRVQLPTAHHLRQLDALRGPITQEMILAMNDLKGDLEQVNADTETYAQLYLDTINLIADIAKKHATMHLQSKDAYMQIATAAGTTAGVPQHLRSHVPGAFSAALEAQTSQSKKTRLKSAKA